jgi:2-iminobutanoate/2-iminopropanoate deaminase
MKSGAAMTLILFFAVSANAQIKAVAPKSATTSTNGLNSPGVLADGYLYVSGQGPRRADGSLPADAAGQIRQALDNVKSVVEAAGLAMENVVYLQVYLEDIRSSNEVNKVFADYFVKSTPARAVLGVARVPEPPVEITAVAVQDLTGLKPVFVAG